MPNNELDIAKALLLKNAQLPFLKEDAEIILKQLRDCIRFFDKKYYVDTETVINDFEYDQLYSYLKNIEHQFPSLITADSPSQRVARALTQDFKQVLHTVPMLSLENSYSEADLLEFNKRIVELTNISQINYVVEPKFDGSSIALVYENDILVRAATRGDGTVGEDITNNAMVIKSIPLSTEFSKHNIAKIELRGEIVIANHFFEKMNAKRAEQGLPIFQNSRNTAAGTLRLKDPNEVAKRGLEAFIYHIAYATDAKGNDLLGNQLFTHNENIHLLHDLGFKTPTIEKQLGDIQSVIAFCKLWDTKRTSYPYEIDGMVVKVDNITMQQFLGATSHHPKWAIAFKFKAKQAITILERIEFQVGRTGAITPVAKLNPIPLAGVTISSVSLHNEEFIKEKDIRLGDTVLVERAGEVIPYIVGVIKEQRKGLEIIIQFPTNCPSCNSDLVKPEEESVWRCINTECPAQIEEKLIHFVSKDAMDIDGLGRSIVIDFIQKGFLKNIEGIFNLPYQDIQLIEGWGEKSICNLKQGIEAAKQRPLWRLIVGLGIRHVGVRTAKVLSKQVKHIKDITTFTIEQLTAIEDVGPKVASSIAEFFHNRHNIELLNALDVLGVNVNNNEDVITSIGKLSGLSFLFTGTLSKFTRDEAKDLVEKNGGKLISGVSKNLNYLVTGAEAGSKLDKAKAINSIKIINEQEFLDLII